MNYKDTPEYRNYINALDNLSDTIAGVCVNLQRSVLNLKITIEKIKDDINGRCYPPTNTEEAK